MINRLILVFSVLFFFGCKTQKVTQNNSLGQKELIVKNIHSFNSTIPEQIKISAKAKVNRENDRQTVGATLYLEDEKKIWVNLSKFGISGARINIDPERIQMFNKLEREYVDQEISSIQEILPKELGLQQLQALLLGRLNPDDLNAEQINIAEVFYEVSQNNGNIQEKYWYDFNFQLSKMEVKYEAKNLFLTAEFKDWQKFDDFSLPSLIQFKVEGNKKLNGELQYNKATFEPFRAKFSIPEGYKKVKLLK